ncbi:hypothetical protein BU15DRAFT_68957 [Melanogaster broomeanus]|nr:hypothetical protein BU15DRAFT_68957 [Melanogaster broomeanus]
MEDNYPIPSNADFERMPSSPMLQVRSEITGRIYTFNIGDNMVIISTSDEKWHARLLDIRHDKVEDVVWLWVQWFHNVTDLRNQSQELVLSHDIDLVEAGCLERKECIIMFDEGAAFRPAIGPTQRYMRWSMKVKDVRTIWIRSQNVLAVTRATIRIGTCSDSVAAAKPGIMWNALRGSQPACQAFRHRWRCKPASLMDD